MDSAQEMSSQEKENLAGDVMDSLGSPDAPSGEMKESNDSQSPSDNNDPLYVQKRLKQQKRAHEREIRELHGRMNEMQSRLAAPNQQSYGYADVSNTQTPPIGSGVDEQIHKAVSYALQQKDMQERQAKDMQSRAHVDRQYQDLQKHLDQTSDKYDDFDDVVRGQDAPYTSSMRDAALMLPKTGSGSAGEVLYELGKNRDELSRIAQLHPLDQAAEMIRLSHDKIMRSGGEKGSNNTRPLGQIKNNPIVNTAGVTDKTPPSEIRARMKAGKFK